MVPEFMIPKDVEDVGVYEEELCWQNVLLQLKFFYEKGFRNIVALDFDDIRTRELPAQFKGYNFITLKLISSDTEQTKRQMKYRHNHEGGLYVPDYVERSNDVIMSRELLPNEVMIDVAGKSKQEVLKEAMNIIDNFQPLKEYTYVLPDEKLFLSWVQSRKLF